MYWIELDILRENFTLKNSPIFDQFFSSNCSQRPPRGLLVVLRLPPGVLRLFPCLERPGRRRPRLRRQDAHHRDQEVHVRALPRRPDPRQEVQAQLQRQRRRRRRHHLSIWGRETKE